jgi:hypothetical protein
MLMVCATVMMVLCYLRAQSRQARNKQPAAQHHVLVKNEPDESLQRIRVNEGTKESLQDRVCQARQRANALVRKQRLEAYTTQMRNLKEMGLAYQVKQPTFSRQFNLCTISPSIAEDFDSDSIRMSFASSGKSRGDSNSSSSSSSSLDGEKGAEPRDPRDFESQWHGSFGEAAGCASAIMRTDSTDSATGGLDTISE